MALERQTEDDYQAQNNQEQVVTDNFTALFPTLYLKTAGHLRDGTFEKTLMYTRFALNMIAKDRQIMPCIMKEMMSDKDFKYYIDMIRDMIKPDGVAYWDSYRAWAHGWGIDKLQMLERLNRT